MKEHLDFLHKELLPFMNHYNQLCNLKEREDDDLNDYFAAHHDFIRGTGKRMNFFRKTRELGEMAEEYRHYHGYGTFGLVHRPETSLSQIEGLLIFHPFGIPRYIHPISGTPLIQFVRAGISGTDFKEYNETSNAFHLFPFDYYGTAPVGKPSSLLSGEESELVERMRKGTGNIKLIDLLKEKNPEDVSVYNRLDGSLGNYGVIPIVSCLEQSHRHRRGENHLSSIIYPILRGGFLFDSSYMDS